MKNYFLIGSLICVLSSCTEGMENLDGRTGKESVGLKEKSGNKAGPENAANPFDDAGKLHNELLEAYCLLPNRSESHVVAGVDSLAQLNVTFNGLLEKPFQGTDASRVGAIAGSGFIDLELAVAASAMSAYGKASLVSFADDLMLLYGTEDDFDAVHAFIISYEMSVLGDAALTVVDKKTILVTASITRYAAYASKKKPKKNTDPEWDLMVGHIIASVDGAGTGVADAVLMALSVGIVENMD